MSSAFSWTTLIDLCFPKVLFPADDTMEVKKRQFEASPENSGLSAAEEMSVEEYIAPRNFFATTIDTGEIIAALDKPYEEILEMDIGRGSEVMYLRAIASLPFETIHHN